MAFDARVATLQGRFKECKEHDVRKALRESRGHAGRAAAELESHLDPRAKEERAQARRNADMFHHGNSHAYRWADVERGDELYALGGESHAETTFRF